MGGPPKHVIILSGNPRHGFCAIPAWYPFGVKLKFGCETADGVAVFAPDGKMIGGILLPERCANVCFGASATALFMAASQSLYAAYVETSILVA
jgi:hypothetical protein